VRRRGPGSRHRLAVAARHHPRAAAPDPARLAAARRRPGLAHHGLPLPGRGRCSGCWSCRPPSRATSSGWCGPRCCPTPGRCRPAGAGCWARTRRSRRCGRCRSRRRS
jgi:hypothetical protein